jgi:hypothetical protein
VSFFRGRIPVEDGARYVTIQWKQGAHQIAAAGAWLIREEGAVTAKLTYRYANQSIEDPIRLVQTASNLPNCPGGRWWWLCPRCLRRAGVLYAPGRYWRCRYCWKITYTSSNESDKRVSQLLRGDLSSIPIASPLYDAEATSAAHLISLAKASFSGLALLLKAHRREEKQIERELRRLNKAAKGKRRKS